MTLSLSFPTGMNGEAAGMIRRILMKMLSGASALPHAAPVLLWRRYPQISA